MPVSKPASFTKPEATSTATDIEQPEEVSEVKIPPKAAVSSDKAQDVLALIRARQQAKA